VKGGALAQREPSVRQGPRLFGVPTEPLNLFRVCEMIRADVGGEAQIVQRRFATKKQINRFTNSLDNPALIGDKARHAVRKTQPPKKPMSLPEAQAFRYRASGTVARLEVTARSRAFPTRTVLGPSHPSSSVVTRSSADARNG